jgi:hypothetical protein
MLRSNRERNDVRLSTSALYFTNISTTLENLPSPIYGMMGKTPIFITLIRQEKPLILFYARLLKMPQLTNLLPPHLKQFRWAINQSLAPYPDPVVL